MNSKENQLAQQLLDEAINAARQEPDKAHKLMMAYRELIAAYAARVQADKEVKP